MYNIVKIYRIYAVVEIVLTVYSLINSILNGTVTKLLIGCSLGTVVAIIIAWLSIENKFENEMLHVTDQRLFDKAIEFYLVGVQVIITLIPFFLMIWYFFVSDVDIIPHAFYYFNIILTINTIFSFISISNYSYSATLFSKAFYIVLSSFFNSNMITLLRNFLSLKQSDDTSFIEYFKTIFLLIENPNNKITDLFEINSSINFLECMHSIEKFQYSCIIGLPLVIYISVNIIHDIRYDKLVIPDIKPKAIDPMKNEWIDDEIKKVFDSDITVQDPKKDKTDETQASINDLYLLYRIPKYNGFDTPSWTAVDMDATVISNNTGRTLKSPSWYISPSGWSIPVELTTVFKELNTVHYSRVFIPGPSNSGKSILMEALFRSSSRITPIGCHEYSFYENIHDFIISQKTTPTKTDIEIKSTPPLIVKNKNEKYLGFVDLAGELIAKSCAEIIRSDVLILLFDLTTPQQISASMKCACEALHKVKCECRTIMITITKADTNITVQTIMDNPTYSEEDRTRELRSILIDHYGREFQNLEKNAKAKTSKYGITAISGMGRKHHAEPLKWQPEYIEQFINSLWR